MISVIISLICLAVVLILILVRLGEVESLLLDMQEHGVHESLQMSISEESVQSIVDLVIQHLHKDNK